MESKCPDCGSPLLSASRYYDCGADSCGQYVRPYTCLERQVAALTAEVERLKKQIEWAKECKANEQAYNAFE